MREATILLPKRLAWYLAAMLVLLLIASVVRANEPYLASIGPIPMRFADVSSNLFVLPPLAMADPVQTNSKSVLTNAVMASANLGAVTNSAGSGASESTASMTSGSNSASATVLSATAPSVSPHSANDMLNVTPQMLVDYFKPVPGGTNSAGGEVSGTIPVGFTPPTPRGAESSQATYRVQ